MLLFQGALFVTRALQVWGVAMWPDGSKFMSVGDDSNLIVWATG